MPRFAANLTMMFNELPFLDRFGAAAKAGFDAVEFLFPYDHSAVEVRRRVDEAGLAVVLFNMLPGDWAAGERGLAVFPQRSAEFTEKLQTALSYAQAIGVRASIGSKLDSGWPWFLASEFAQRRTAGTCHLSGRIAMAQPTSEIRLGCAPSKGEFR